MVAKRASLSARLLTAKLAVPLLSLVASTACKIAARVPLIVAKRLAKRDNFSRHDEEMINVPEECKSESREIICKGEANNVEQ